MTETVRKTRRPSETPEIKSLNAELQRIREELRKSLIERVVDLQILVGAKQEKNRTEAIGELADPTKYAPEALEVLRKAIFAALLAQRGLPPNENQASPVDYRDLR